VLGDGKQRKSYLYIQDCISAIFTALIDGSRIATTPYYGGEIFAGAAR
jgi:dTDP-D-glucose 4,6-dehydratase